MRRSSQKDFAVYEFKEDDEAVESASGRFTYRSGKRRSRSEEQGSFTSQFTFLKTFAEDMFNDNSSLAGDLTAPGCIAGDSTRMEASSPSTPNSTDDQPNCSLSDKQSNETQPSFGSEDGGSWVASPDHKANESFRDPASSEYWNSAREVEDIDVTVTVAAEYVICGPKFFAESQLIFLADSIKIQCTDIGGKEFLSEYGITDIERINCQWTASAGTTWVKIWLKSNPSSDKVMDACDSSVLKFCVPDFDWLEKERKIMLLAPRYKIIWSTASDVRFSEDEEEVQGFQSNICEHYLPNFMESTDEVIYPKGDPDAVSLSKRDVDLLQPETFINDTIIDFYIKYLTNMIQPKDRHRFHFFNSFFFRKLVDLDKDPLSTAEGRAAFLRVRKWTRKVNIFKKDYLFIPVNYNLHWSLLVICHPGEVAHLKENSIYEASRVPCILHMDSMKGNHDGLKKLIQSYLWEEWKERNSTSIEDTVLTPNFSSLRFIPLELPQQQNAFDCGFFLLHYVELFLKEVPENFNPFVITKFSNFLNTDWFIPDEASHKRFAIRNLIYELFINSNRNKDKEDHHHSSASCSHYQEEKQKEEEEEKRDDLCTTESDLAGCTVEDSLESENDGDEDEEDTALSGGDGTGELQMQKKRKVVQEEET